MNYSNLKAFIAVVEQGSFRAAANSLYKTQSTISASIANLEGEFGLLLFDRESYRPTLTHSGKVFYEEAKHTLKQVTQLEKLGHSLAASGAPHLSLAFSALCVQLEDLIQMQQFASDYPELELNMMTENLSGLKEALVTEKADIALSPNYAYDDSFERELLANVQLITVAAPHFMPDISERILIQDDIRNKPQILIADTGTQERFDHKFVLDNGRRWYVNDYMIKKRLLLAGLGWARIPLHMVEDDLHAKRLLKLDIEGFEHTSDIPIYLVRRKEPHTKIAEDCWQFLKRKSVNNEC